MPCRWVTAVSHALCAVVQQNWGTGLPRPNARNDMIEEACAQQAMDVKRAVFLKYWAMFTTAAKLAFVPDLARLSDKQAGERFLAVALKDIRNGDKFLKMVRRVWLSIDSRTRKGKLKAEAKARFDLKQEQLKRQAEQQAAAAAAGAGAGAGSGTGAAATAKRTPAAVTRRRASARAEAAARAMTMKTATATLACRLLGELLGRLCLLC